MTSHEVSSLYPGRGENGTLEALIDIGMSTFINTCIALFLDFFIHVRFLLCLLSNALFLALLVLRINIQIPYSNVLSSTLTPRSSIPPTLSITCAP